MNLSRFSKYLLAYVILAGITISSIMYDNQTFFSKPDVIQFTSDDMNKTKSNIDDIEKGINQE